MRQPNDTAVGTDEAIAAVFRIERPKLVAGLARVVRDVGLAEELAQDAIVVALEQWPRLGVPERPGAWLMTTAKRRAIDLLRRERRFVDKRDGFVAEGAASPATSEDDWVTALDAEPLEGPDGDDLLRLMFVACHPILSRESRVALTLRLLGGLTTDEISRAFLLPETTIAQRIVRAKRALAEAGVGFEVPRGDEIGSRLSSVLEVIYLVFNEGYSATSGADWTRPALCEEALRLGRILAALLPHEGEVHGLLALMELQASRLAARTTPDGEPILLLDQNRARWDPLLIRRGLAALARAVQSAGGELERGGPYLLQAAIAACHARARTAEETDWRHVAALYAVLARRWPSPVVELNRAVAISMAYGPEAALPLVEALTELPDLGGYHLLAAVRADLLRRLGRHGEASEQFERAAAQTRNERERALLGRKAEESRRDASRRPHHAPHLRAPNDEPNDDAS